MTKTGKKFICVLAITIMSITTLCVVVTILNLFIGSKVLLLLIYGGLLTSVMLGIIGILKVTHDAYKMFCK